MCARLRAPAALLVVILAGAMAACEAPSLGPVAVYRTHPDTLLVQVGAEAVALGRGAGPDTLTITASDGRGFVLAERQVVTGGRSLWALRVPDGPLPSRSRLMVEVCGRVARRPVCEQRSVTATPKRVRAAVRLSYPPEGDRERAVARVDSVVFERYDGARWRALPVPEGLGYTLQLWVDGAPSEGLSVPLRAGRDTVLLTPNAGYDRYWLRLNERLFYGEGTQVHLALRAHWPAGSAELVHALRTVRPFTRNQQQARIEAFADGARRGIARAMGYTPDSSRVRVTGWAFDRIRQRYRLDLLVSMRDSTGGEVLRSGRLDVGESGQEALFRETARDSTPPRVLRLGRLSAAKPDNFNGS